MTPIRVRTATRADAAAITAVHLASRAAAMPWLPTIHTDEEAQAWFRDVVLPGSRVWVAEEPVAGDGGGGAVRALVRRGDRQPAPTPRP